METENAQTNAPTVGGEQTATQPTPELTINDLANVRSILDVAVRRGVFAANELSGVGAVYDKLNVFLNAISAQTEAEKKQ
jgi:hypothetical protein